MAKYVRVKLNSGYDVLPVTLEGTIESTDGCRLALLTNPIGVSLTQIYPQCIFNSKSEAARSDYFVDRIDMQKDVKRDLVAQLRELADVIEKDNSPSH